MELNRLRYFVVVAERGSISRAAEFLHITPTALSKAVKLLELEVGAKLVEPDGRRIRITEEGRILAERSAPLLAEIAALPHEIDSSRRQSAQVLRLGSHEVFATYLLSFLIGYLADQGHRPTVEHRYLIPGQIENLVRDRHIDIGMTYNPVPTAGVEHLDVTKVPMGIFGLKKKAKQRFEEWEFAAPLRPVVGSPTRGQGLDGWPDDRISRTVRYRITNTETALELCRQGFAVAYFPEFVVHLHNEVTDPPHRLVRLPNPKGLGQHYETVRLALRSGEGVPEFTSEVKSALQAAAKLG